MKITDIETFVVEKPDLDLTAADSTQDALIVRVRTDEGLAGIGEGNSTPRALKAYIDAPGSHAWSQGVKDLLIGRDPLDPERLWDDVYRATAMGGRRGLGIVALAAIDVALWDLKGKAEGRPIYELLGGASGRPVVPYITSYSGPLDYEDAVRANLDVIERSRAAGFRAVKLEPLIDCVPTNELIVDFVRRSRETARDLDMLVDVGHRWQSGEEALRWLAEIEPYDPALIETPLWLDDVEGYRVIADGSDVPVALGELFVTRNEFVEMMDHGHVDVIQPCVARIGFTQARRVAADALARGRRIVPFGWLATTIGVAANLHFAATLDNSPWCEYAPPEIYAGSELRRDLVGPEPRLAEGTFVLPAEPGLGVELDDDALRRYSVAV